MMIIIDADATPNIQAIIDVAEEYAVRVTLVANHHHQHDYPNVTLFRVDDGHDESDYKIVAITQAGDCIVTQDYGLAALVLARGAFAVHPLGWQYTPQNIDAKLASRHLSLITRNVSKRYPKHKKRTDKDSKALLQTLRQILAKETG